MFVIFCVWCFGDCCYLLGCVLYCVCCVFFLVGEFGISGFFKIVDVVFKIVELFVMLSCCYVILVEKICL